MGVLALKATEIMKNTSLLTLLSCFKPFVHFLFLVLSLIFVALSSNILEVIRTLDHAKTHS